MGLEETIRGLAGRGELSHISLAFSATSNKFRAVFTPCSRYGNSIGEDDDPVKAVMLACAAIKVRPPKQPSHRPALELTAERVGEDRVPEDVEDLM